MSDDPWLTAISPDDIEAAMQRKAAREALIVEQAAEITRLCAALATARREGMEEAAKIAEDEPEPEGEPPQELHGRSVKNIAIASIRATKRNIAAAIRAVAGEVK